MHQREDEIANLEAEIEGLSDAAERCQKIESAAKVAIAVGGLLLLVVATGMLRLGPEPLLLGIAATLGGIALKGSSRSSRDKIMASIRALEAQRAELIDTLGLRAIRDE